MMTLINKSEVLSHKFDTICRLCLTEEGPMSSIFTDTSSSGDEEQQDILAMRITSIAHVQISATDGLPGSICHICRQQVDQFYDFRLLVQISDRKLRSYFSGAQETMELKRITMQSTGDDKDVEYQEFSVDTTKTEKDLLSVNAILVPSTSGMQVWQICNIEEQASDSEYRQQYSTIEASDNVCPKLEYDPHIVDSDLDDFKGVKCCLAQSVDPITIKSMHKEDELYFAPAVTEEEQKTQNRMNTEIAEDEVYEEEHLILDEYSCQLCLKSFQALEALKNHVSDHLLDQYSKNSGSVSKACVEQEIDASGLRNYETMDKNRDEELPDRAEYIDSVICQSCDESFDTVEERVQHVQRGLSVTGLKCRHCDKSFLKLSSRNYHEESFHGSINDKPHKCDECDKEFGKRSELRYHKGTHNKVPPTCTICNKHFCNVQSFRMHLKRHTLGSRYNCTDCGKSYYTNAELARHVQQHTGLREYPCDLCDMSFLSKPELNRHVKYHKGVKKFQCKVCQKSYFESGHLKVHERVHTGERPFVCIVCEKGFITKAKLVRHLKVHTKTRGSDRDSPNICE